MTAQQKSAPSCGHVVFVDVSIMKAMEIVLGQLHKLLCALGFSAEACQWLRWLRFSGIRRNVRHVAGTALWLRETGPGHELRVGGSIFYCKSCKCFRLREVCASSLARGLRGLREACARLARLSACGRLARARLARGLRGLREACARLARWCARLARGVRDLQVFHKQLFEMQLFQ